MIRRKAALAACAAALSAGALATIGLSAASASSSGRATLAGTAASSAARANPAGAVSSSSPVDFSLVLALRNESGAQAFAKAVSTPGSASYRHYLSAAAWEARYSPTQAAVDQARQWLAGEGFTVSGVAKDRMTIRVSGTAGQVEHAFGVSLGYYEVNGQKLREVSGNLSVPSGLAGIVSGAIGINQHVATPSSTAGDDFTGGGTNAATSTGTSYPPPPPLFPIAPPCSAYYGQQTETINPPPFAGYPSTVPDVVCGYKPGQLRTAYGVPSGVTGKGVTVAIIDAYDSATIGQDATKYFATEDPGNPFSNAHFTQVDNTPFTNEALCSASGWLTEQAIDVESVHSLAPDANITYVGAASCLDTDLFAAEQDVVDNQLANVVSNSWSDTGGDLLTDAAEKTAFDNLFLMAAGEGIGIQFSSGDDGDNFYLLGFSSADYPSESPYVTSVGGTSLAIGANGQRIGEWGWDTGRSFYCTSNVESLLGCTYATWTPARPDGISGGFTSYNYTQPYYQAGIVPAPLALRNDAITGSTPMRVEPDISAVADPGTGFLIGYTQTNPDGSTSWNTTRYGGTSLASPVMAGIVADADQLAGQPLGFLNPALYRMERLDPSSIYDVGNAGKQANFRNDYVSALFGTGSGTVSSYRELYYRGPEIYCDATGNCAQRQEPLTAGPGYDSLTGLGSPGADFIGALAAF